jgi:succinate dehydrogenase / fumarate reductase cytochrome b subunit
MWLTGLLTLAFVISHLIHFKFVDHEAGGGLYAIVIRRFQSLPFVAWYVLAVCALGLHVGHGLGSAVRTLGFHHPKYTPCVEWCSRAFGVIVAGGFAALPIWAYLAKGSP